MPDPSRTVSISRPLLRDLELVARKVVEGVRHGMHRSPFHGFSAEFHQYRQYRPGDDLRHVDWKLFGRTDRFYTRQFRETTSAALLFVIDLSRSMHYPPSGRTKLELAQTAAAALATLAVDQGDAVGLYAAGARATYVPARSGRHHLRSWLARLAGLTATSNTSVATALARVPALLRRRGMVLVFSDFYDADQTWPVIRRLDRMGHDVTVVHVLSREELDLRGLPGGRFVDLETGDTMPVDTAGGATAYRRAIAAFLDDTHRTAQREQLGYLRLSCDEPLDTALRRYLVARSTGAHGMLVGGERVATSGRS